MPLRLSGRGLPHLLPVLALLSIPIALYGVALLFDSGVAWSNPEYLVFSLPGSLRNGAALQWTDFVRGFEPHLFDEIRPRFINYIITIINVKLRLLSYSYFIPPVNLSIGTIVHVLAAPLLFYILCRKLSAGVWAALLGACLYVCSVGFLSTAAFFVQPGKNLDPVLTLLLLVGLATLHEKAKPLAFGEERRGIVAAIMFFNFVCISIDELCLVSSLVGVVMFFRLFAPVNFSRAQLLRSIRALFLYFLPFLAFLLFTAIAAPRIGYAAGAGWCDYLASFFTLANRPSTQGPFLIFMYDLISTSLASFFLPYPFPKGMAPFALSLSGWAALALGIIIIAVLALITRRACFASPSLDRLGVRERVFMTTIAYFILQTLLHRVGGQVTGGYYYCSLSALFVSLLLVSLFASPDAGLEKIVIPFLLPALMVIQIGNFLDLNTRWRSSNAIAIRTQLDRFHAYPNLIITPDGPRTAEQNSRMVDLWSRWKRGEHLDEGLMQNWPVGDGWFLMELNALDGHIFRIPEWRCY